jgi:VIT1/CCC1 family predicted Fe2+/Mn2+ transporter
VAARVLDPLERASEVLFGVIMVLTFTGSISVAEGGRAEARELLVGAIACNVAWGIVDAVMYLLASLTERARALARLRAIRDTVGSDAAHQLILGALPDEVRVAVTAEETRTLHQRLRAQSMPALRASLHLDDLLGALAVFLVVSLSTFPLVVPFLLVPDIAVALRLSNTIAIAMLFVIGWRLGTFAGSSGWRVGLAMVAIGLVLVAVTMALGG